MIRLVPEREPDPIDPMRYKTEGRKLWLQAKDAHLDAMQWMATLTALMHKSGNVPTHRIKGALSEAKRTREALDRVIVALGDVVEIGKRVEADQ